MLLNHILAMHRRAWAHVPKTRLSGWLWGTIRGIDATAARMIDGELSLRAMGLVYTTLLSLTPMLAIGFSVLKALGIHTALQPMLVRALSGLGTDKAQEVANSVVGFVEKVQVGVLGSVGVILLIYSAISLIEKIEASFNHVWRVERSRSLQQRFGEYLTVLMIGPVILFALLKLITSFMSSHFMNEMARYTLGGFLIESSAGLLPSLTIIGVFIFLYRFIPNTKVSGKAACIGGVVAGLAWQSASYVFAAFVVSASNYNAIYSGFAIVLFVLIWLYVAWLILLIGCQIAYFVQFPERMNPYAVPIVMEGRTRERLALALIYHVGVAFMQASAPLKRGPLAQKLGISEKSTADLANVWVSHGVITAGVDHYVLTHDPERYTLGGLWALLRGTPTDAAVSPNHPVDQWLTQAEAAATTAHPLNLRAWLQQNIYTP